MPISAKRLLKYLQLSSKFACVEVHPAFLIKLVLEICFSNLHEAVIDFLLCGHLSLSQ